jgi:hypothetical protein
MLRPGMMLPIALAGMVLGRDGGTTLGCDARASGTGVVGARLLLM